MIRFALARLRRLAALGAPRARVVPPSGFTVWLTFGTAAAMGFLAVFALALSLAAGQVAERWSDALSRTATVRISAPEGQVEAQVAAVLRILAQTPGIAEARRLPVAEQKALLEPWLGADLPLDLLTLPELIELVEADPGYDAEGLRLRLAGEAPGAVLDDHGRWRRPVALASARLRLLGIGATLLIAAATSAMVVLAAQAALAGNRQVIRTLRLIGATDGFIAGAFIHRFAWRAALGAAVGTLAAMVAIALLPVSGADTGVISGLGFVGAGWLLPLLVPPMAAAIAFGATKFAAFRTLRETT